ncbi:MAG: ATP-binding cassette domain-containing protein [Cumulibacter sp.]
MITAEHLTKRYGRITAVDDISFRCEPGTVTGFLGPNGAGKSTTLRMLAGLSSPTSGRSTINGLQYASPPGMRQHSIPGGPAWRRSASPPASWACRSGGRRKCSSRSISRAPHTDG